MEPSIDLINLCYAENLRRQPTSRRTGQFPRYTWLLSDPQPSYLRPEQYCRLERRDLPLVDDRLSPGFPDCQAPATDPHREYSDPALVSLLAHLNTYPICPNRAQKYRTREKTIGPRRSH